jgi:N-acyl-phosphatidylethanolamine-hydrolysing phospholipase D
MGPKRYTEMPCQIDDIPFIDAVVISHNHYDHLDHPTITKIIKRFPNVHFFVPLNNKQWFLDSGFHNVTELDWWEEKDLTLKPKDKSPFDDSPNTSGDITAKIGCLPCQHTSNRGLFDRSHTLWASWSIESGGKKVWFGGYVILVVIFTRSSLLDGSIFITVLRRVLKSWIILPYAA